MTSSKPNTLKKCGTSPKKLTNKNPSESSECDQIVTHKGIGINEQNIIQIICKSSEPANNSDAELVKLYKVTLEEKEKEIVKLRDQLQSESKVSYVVLIPR